MKKTTIASLALSLAAGTAHAQSSVTLYGLIDAGLVYVNNQSGHSNIEAVNGQTNGSRWGLRGAEDRFEHTLAERRHIFSRCHLIVACEAASAALGTAVARIRMAKAQAMYTETRGCLGIYPQ